MINKELSNIVFKKKENISIVITSYQPNKKSSNILKTALKSLMKIKNENISIWVFDIGSKNKKFLINSRDFPEINFIYVTKTPHSNDGVRFSGKRDLYINKIKKFFRLNASRNGSHINGWTIDYAIKYFNNLNYNPIYFMTMHMDITVISKNFINEIIEKFNKKTCAVGVLKQKNLGGQFEILHCLGCMWKYELLKNPNYSFLPELPHYDAGEKIFKMLYDKGYKIEFFENSLINSNLLNLVEEKYKNIGSRGVDLTLNKNNEVIFIHLGRGINKSMGIYFKKNKVEVNEWIKIND